MFGYRWRWPMNEMKSELVQTMKLFLEYKGRVIAVSYSTSLDGSEKLMRLA